ncbi:MULTISPECIES: 2-oxoacid:acceptor oxidoreductase family protein [Thermoanaerobacterium]|uniref:Pyruvate/ketoisovalerate oxidoreductase subunit gamma n=2 Tax=Thermoanaerobacterium TaxID=28895 RepID=W9EEF7_9THEO|nr:MULTISPECIES: 2-oxoacid:acceptor oxidoreductase family protein [Thermoanaerobacterium]AFK87181.1 pyruvate/ketoisovalerate oxidoreductase, gamma subunit [Thermoanaerobacterium saccharolyticum JW/SL-YS485]ETO38144.1 pyruvate/ketoisovalerate oxidoreductase subunit gamma [Thermoanaerobacterium aotearoense SCUT27]
MEERIIFAGFGGQGIMSMGLIMSYAGMMDGKNVSWLPSYGPEMRGGTANCHVTISDEPVGSPIINEATVVVAMNRPSLEKYEKYVVPGGKLFINTSLIKEKAKRSDIEIYEIAANDIANEIGNLKIANMVILGGLIKATNITKIESALKALVEVLGPSKEHLVPINEKALEKGAELIEILSNR